MQHMEIMYQNGWKKLTIFIHVENIKYFQNASQKIRLYAKMNFNK
jgi:hypothetical protein